jgi:hypothetical protein
VNNDLRGRVLIVLSKHHVRLGAEQMSALVDDLCALIRTPGTSAEGWEPAKNRNQERTRRKNPAPGKRVCATCGKTRSLRVFGMRDGQPKSSCNDCLAAYQRNRYVSAKKLRALNVLRLEVVADDEIAGLRCIDCKQVIAVGDEIVCQSGVTHLACAADEVAA